MKIYSKEHEKALKLKHNMDLIEKQHLNHINNYDKLISKAKTPESKKRVENAWRAQEKKFESKEDIAYSNYYNHMHKHLNIPKNSKEFTKYKDGFADKKFINKMFKEKFKKDKKMERTNGK